MALWQLYRGLDAKYEASRFKDGIYFATDTGCIYLNGVRYGGNDTTLTVKDVEIKNSLLIVTYTDGTSNEFKFEDLIANATSTSAGLMSAEDKTVIETVSNAITSGMTFLTQEQSQIISAVKSGTYTNKVEGVSAVDNLLSLTEDKLLSATISINYDSENKKIKLLGKSNVELSSIDATPFIKDGMLDNVRFVVNPTGYPEGKYLIFTWNTQSGISEPMYVPLSDLVTVYEAGNAIDITNNVISVKVKENDPYLVIESGVLATKGIDTAINALSEQIESAVAGGVTTIVGDDFISVTKDSAIRSLSFNVSKVGTSIVDSNASALKADSDSGKLTIQWEEL